MTQKEFFCEIVPLIEELEAEFKNSPLEVFEKIRRDTMARVSGTGVVEKIMFEIFNMIYRHIFLSEEENKSE